MLGQAEAQPAAPQGLFSTYLALMGIGSSIMSFVFLVLTVYCIVHVIRNGHDYWWIFLIFFMPMVGSLVYFFAVILPNAGAYKYHHKNDRDYKKDLMRLEGKLQQVDTIATRIELGETCLKLAMYEKARDYFNSCLKGAYANDAYSLYGVSQAEFGLGRFDDALSAIDRTFTDSYRDYLNERLLLKAKILDEQDKNEEALALYADVENKVSTQEAYGRHALLLEKMGKDKDAELVFRTILTNSSVMSSAALKREKQWIDMAKRKLALKAK